MDNLEKILTSICEGRPKGSKNKPKDGAETVVPSDDMTIINGKKSKVDVDSLEGKPASKTGGLFAIDEPTSEDAVRWDGQPKPYNVKKVMQKIKADEPFFILGHAGWGKSTIIKQVAKKCGLSVITVYLDKAVKEDLGGIPVPVASKDGRHELQVLLPGWAQYMYDHPETDFLLFFDEMNQADPEVQNALMPIVLDRRICDIQFDNYTVGAAGNYNSENQALHDLSGPLRSRFEPIIIWKDNDDESWQDWLNYMKGEINKRYSTKINGNAMKILDAIEPFVKNFKNPREIETKIFDWAAKLVDRAARDGENLADGDYVDMDEIEDRLATLLTKENDLNKLGAETVLTKSQYKDAIEKMAGAIWDAMTEAPSSSKGEKEGENALDFDDDEIKNMADAINAGEWKFNDDDGNILGKVVLTKDNIQEVFDLDKQQYDFLMKKVFPVRVNKWKHGDKSEKDAIKDANKNKSTEDQYITIEAAKKDPQIVKYWYS